MKRIIVIFVLICSLFVVALYAATIPIKGYVTPDVGLNIRSGPSTETSLIGFLPQGTNISIVAVKNGCWYKISSPMSGYVHGDYVAVTEYGEAPEDEEDDDDDEDDSTLTPNQAEKKGCNLEKSIKKAKIRKAPKSL